MLRPVWCYSDRQHCSKSISTIRSVGPEGPVSVAPGIHALVVGLG
jgi:hypothetical protein